MCVACLSVSLGVANDQVNSVPHAQAQRRTAKTGQRIFGCGAVPLIAKRARLATVGWVVVNGVDTSRFGDLP